MKNALAKRTRRTRPNVIEFGEHTFGSIAPLSIPRQLAKHARWKLRKGEIWYPLAIDCYGFGRHCRCHDASVHRLCRSFPFTGLSNAGHDASGNRLRVRKCDIDVQDNESIDVVGGEKNLNGSAEVIRAGGSDH